MKKRLILLAVLTAAFLCQASADEADDFVRQTLQQMTLQEKVRLCYAQGKFSSPGVPRLGIPEMTYSDGPHGVRAEINWNNWGYASWTSDSITAFPALTCLAATWNTALATKYGAAIGEEARYRKKSVLLGPGVNIFRTPLNGRNFEYLGEDPMLAGSFAAPYIRALQQKGVACSLKHFALNNQEEYRGHVNVIVSERALNEIYLPAFRRAVVDGGAMTVMGSYNQYQDVHCSHHDVLLNRILKHDWGFRGMVLTDWGAAHDTEQAIFNGLDVEMGSYTNGLTTEATGFGYDDYYLGRAYREKALRGEVPDSIINDKAARILRVLYLTTMDTSKGFGRLNTQEHLDVAREIAEEGIVLLKNKGQLLPVAPEKYKHILVVGENATRNLCTGGGSSELKPKTLISPLDAIKARWGALTDIDYAQGYESGKATYGTPQKIPAERQAALKAEALAKARQADLVIYIGGLNKNHYEDCEGGDRRSYNMSYGQDSLITELLKVQKNTVVVMVSGTAMAMPWLDKTPALVQSWYLGSEGGTALVNVLDGTVNPSGKTIFTYARKLTDYPAHRAGKVGYPGVEPETFLRATAGSRLGSAAPEEMVSRGNVSSADILALNATIAGIDPSDPALNTAWDTNDHKGQGTEVELYNEDILVGYRWFEAKHEPVVFPFGYGLSYTTFKYSGGSVVRSADGSYAFTVKVRNTGKVRGKEVVQLYVGDDEASVVRPVKELKAFEKVELLPGEEKAVTLHITSDDLKFYDETIHAWKLEPGGFKAYIGASSADIKVTVPFAIQ